MAKSQKSGCRSLRYLAQLEVDKMCARYESECKDLGSHIETNNERIQRLKNKEFKERYKQRHQLHI